MNHPATRVLAALELLQTHGRLSGADLAQRLNVDGRTVRRYIALLEEIGVPVITERGRHGGYELVAGYKLPPMMFTNDEALAVAVGLSAARGFGLEPALDSASAKLERVLPPRIQSRVRAVAETISLERARSPGRDITNVLATLSTAAHSRQGVDLTYRRPSGEQSRRDFDPYGLAHRGGFWYAAGYCHSRRGLRTFRIDRINAVNPQERTFERPATFDIFEHLNQSIASLPRKYTIQVLLRHTNLQAVQKEIFPAFGVLEPLGDDSVLLRGQADDLRWFARELARLPWDFKILKPAALRNAVSDHAKRLLREG